MLHRSKWFVYRNTASLRHRRLREKDSWFFDHFIMTAYEIGEHLSRFIPLNRSRVLDFGCGDGFTALGMSRFGLKEIIGVDINDAFRHLPQIACRYPGLDLLPRSLSFQKVGDGEPLPFETDTFDAVYTWSVLEHVRDVEAVLQELNRVLFPGGILFMQIKPLFHSPFGSHLERLIPEPWAHLTMTEAAFLDRAWNARDQIGEDEKDLVYQRNTFADFKKYLIHEFQNLNRITAGELLVAAHKSRFTVLTYEKRKDHSHSPPLELLDRYSEEDLLTSEVRLTLRKG